MKMTTNLMTGLLILPFLAACQDGSSNPIKDYSDIKTGPVTERKVEFQTVAPETFSVKVAGTNQVNNGNFIEGQQGQVAIEIKPKTLKITKYTVELTDFPIEDRPALVPTEEANMYALQWNPPVGTIPPGVPGTYFNAKIRVEAVEPEQYKGLVTEAEVTVNVGRNMVQPKILGRSDLKAGIEEGKDTPFSVDIEDPGTASSPRLPEIQVTPYISSNTEAYCADGSHYVVLDDKRQDSNPEKISATKWRFYYLLQVDRLPLDRDRRGVEIPMASSVDMCFQMRAVSVSGTSSEQIQVRTNARYAVQPPVMSLSEADVSEVKAGVESTFTVKAAAAHPMAVVILETPVKQIAKLSGTKSITCSYESAEKKNEATCVIKWTPACVKTAAKTTLSLKAENRMNQKVKSAVLTKELTVSPNPEACVAPARTGGHR